MYAEETSEWDEQPFEGDRHDSFAPTGDHLTSQGKRKGFRNGNALGRREIWAIFLAAAATGICAIFDLLMQNETAPED